ncbi:MAG: transposase [candidate division Zixibacteria bacterium]|nr:transposase [candidate division Zixibacteria bacterium]
MTNIRRFKNANQIYFLTHITYKRKPILLENVNLLWDAVKFVKSNINFEMTAWAILPDHFHMIIDPYNNDISEIVKKIKLKFSGLYRSKNNLKSGRLWQYRFWDHVIRDEEDLSRHLDYIHYNPVKHGLTSNPHEYCHSSLHLFREQGYYAEDWGKKDEVDFVGAYGE